MTPAEWTEAVRLHDAYWRRSPLPDATIRAWWHKLREQPGHRVQQALYDLADDPRRPPDVGHILQRCREIAHNTAMAEPLERPAIPAGPDRDPRWATLPTEQQRHWIEEARRQWPDWLPKAKNCPSDTPFLIAHAAALANDMNPPPIPRQLEVRPRCSHHDCEAILLPGFDPPGDRCRHHTRPTDREPAA